MKLSQLWCISAILVLVQVSTGAELRTDLPEYFAKYYILGSNDFSLAFDPGNADYQIKGPPGMNFLLKMTEELSVYDTSPNKHIEMCNGTVTDLDTGKIGVTYGSITKDTEIFRGQFIIDDVTYYVEDADKYLNAEQMKTQPTPVSILYMSIDVITPEGKFEAEELVYSPDFEDDEDKLVFPKRNDNTNGIANRFQQANRGNQVQDICDIDIRIDNGVYRMFGRDKNKIRNSIYQQVMTLNRIYGSTFKDGDYPKVKFTIGRLAIATDSFCRTRSTNIHCQQRSFHSSSTYLNTFSKQNVRKYCLSYMYTTRNFGSTLGVAWVGGVCNSGRQRSYNTGFVVIRGTSTQFATDLTFAHEVGHNFGSSHDTARPCTGDNRNGRFLMFPSTSPRRQPNNDKFSTCSKRSIDRTFRLIDTNRKTGCFKQSRTKLEEARLEGDDDDDIDEVFLSGTSSVKYFHVSILLMPLTLSYVLKI